mmetsp:Transcript_98156/g.283162  ORF Transcript_98156/g.283162 Transcript_98156/m.283162 type:complete len:370 (-) Transcript_98156:764-1873(-)
MESTNSRWATTKHSVSDLSKSSWSWRVSHSLLCRTSVSMTAKRSLVQKANSSSFRKAASAYALHLCCASVETTSHFSIAFATSTSTFRLIVRDNMLMSSRISRHISSKSCFVQPPASRQDDSAYAVILASPSRISSRNASTAAVCDGPSVETAAMASIRSPMKANSLRSAAATSSRLVDVASAKASAAARSSSAHAALARAASAEPCTLSRSSPRILIDRLICSNAPKCSCWRRSTSPSSVSILSLDACQWSRIFAACSRSCRTVCLNSSSCSETSTFARPSTKRGRAPTDASKSVTTRRSPATSSAEAKSALRPLADVASLSFVSSAALSRPALHGGDDGTGETRCRSNNDHSPAMLDTVLESNRSCN